MKSNLDFSFHNVSYCLTCIENNSYKVRHIKIFVKMYFMEPMTIFEYSLIPEIRPRVEDSLFSNNFDCLEADLQNWISFLSCELR